MAKETGGNAPVRKSPKTHCEHLHTLKHPVKFCNSLVTPNFELKKTNKLILDLFK